MPVAEVEVPYAERTAGTTSKLRTIPDGIKIFWESLMLFKESYNRILCTALK